MMRTGILDDGLDSLVPETAFLLNRPATVGLAAPRIESGSEGPACVLVDTLS